MNRHFIFLQTFPMEEAGEGVWQAATPTSHGVHPFLCRVKLYGVDVSPFLLHDRAVGKYKKEEG